LPNFSQLLGREVAGLANPFGDDHEVNFRRAPREAQLAVLI
jgi:hypothetical protein